MPFSTYMDWVLHDPDHGAYGAGRLRIGPRGDFATAPSLGPDFAALLAPQLAQWLQELPGAKRRMGAADQRSSQERGPWLWWRPVPGRATWPCRWPSS